MKFISFSSGCIYCKLRASVYLGGNQASLDDCPICRYFKLKNVETKLSNISIEGISSDCKKYDTLFIHRKISDIKEHFS